MNMQRWKAMADKRAESVAQVNSETSKASDAHGSAVGTDIHPYTPIYTPLRPYLYVPYLHVFAYI